MKAILTALSLLSAVACGQPETQSNSAKVESRTSTSYSSCRRTSESCVGVGYCFTYQNGQYVYGYSSSCSGFYYVCGGRKECRVN